MKPPSVRHWTTACLAVVAVASTVAAEDAHALRITGRDGESVSLSVVDLAALPQTEVTGKEKSGSSAKFSGVDVAVLLAKVGVPTGEDLRGPWLRCHVIVSASDGYQVAFGIAEFDASFTDIRIVLADRRNGEPLDAAHGPLQIVVPHEKRHSRWVRMVKEIRIVDSSKTEAPDTN